MKKTYYAQENVLKTKTFWHITWFDSSFKPGVGGGGVGLRRGSKERKLVFSN